MGTITVKGTGNVSARPDYIILTLDIEALSEYRSGRQSQTGKPEIWLRNVKINTEKDIFDSRNVNIHNFQCVSYKIAFGSCS